MAKRRKARTAPKYEDPYEDYSTWDLRIAKAIYYGIIVASLITILGIWLTIIGLLIDSDLWAEFIALGPGWIALTIVGIVVLHLFLLVLFYILFRGGILKLCKKLFKDRELAKKYEDYTTLRLLLAVTLISVYIFIITLIVIILPAIFWQTAAQFWTWVITTFNFGNWVLFIGLIMFLVILIVYLGFFFWNHSVYAVLKRVKKIEEEYEIDEEIKKEELKGADEETLQKIYKKQTGKNPIYRGKETKGYIEWKNKMLE